LTVLATLDINDSASFFKINQNVKWYKLSRISPNAIAPISEKFRRMKSLRSLVKLEKIDVVIGFQSGIVRMAVLALLGIKIKIIASERESRTKYDFVSRGFRNRLVDSFFLNFVDRIQVLFPRYIQMYPLHLQKKIVAIPNAIENMGEIRKSEPEDSRYHVMFIGRLDFPKNPDLLLEAFLTLPAKYKLSVVGAGSMLNVLHAKYAHLDRINFFKPNHDLGEFLSGAHCICLPSYWEGFPNVIAESLACGVPALGFENTAGVSDLIINHVNGYLIPGPINSSNLHQGIVRISEMKFKTQEIKDSVSKYTDEKVQNSWKSLLQSLLEI